MNVIPAVLIQSVEILKTGASSIYGSDAIAGVANLKTKRATDGLEIRGNLTRPFEKGAESYNVNAAWGKEFDRGHFIAGVDFFKRSDMSRGDRDYLFCSEEYIFNQAGARVDVLDPRTGRPRCNTTQYSYLQVSTSATGAPNTINPTIRPGLTYSVIGFSYPGDRFSEFLPNAALAGPGYTFPTGLFPLAVACNVAASQVAADAELCRNSLALLPQASPLVAAADVFPALKRYTGWLDSSFEISDAVEVTGEFLFNRRETESDSLRQLFFQQFSGATTTPVGLCNATRQIANPLCIPTGTGDPQNAGFAGNFFITPVVPIATFVSTKVDYKRGVVGLKADLGSYLPSWRLDSYVQYSHSDGEYTNSRILQDAVELQELRSQNCAPGQVTRIRGVPCINIDFTDPRILAGDFNAAEQAFLFGKATGKTVYTQLTGEASVAGTLFKMPAGDVGMAFGVQWRRDTIDDTPSSIDQAPNPRFNASIPAGDPRCLRFDQPCERLVSNSWSQSVAGRTAGFTRSQEAFGELEVPLIHNTPFVQNFTVSAAARITSVYAERDSDGKSDSNKGNWTYKLGANWQVNDWLRFRATMGTSFRAPALFEQFLNNQTGFQGQNAIDYCVNFTNLVNLGVYSQRIGQNCTALGLPANYQGGGAGSAVIATRGGIGELEPETSKAKTFSVVLTPTVGLWEGMRFSVAVDYFDIEVKDQLTSFGAANIVFSCLESDNFPTDPICGFITRQLDPNAAFFGSIISVRNPYININSQRNRGLDLTARVSQDLGRFGRLAILGQGTWQLEDRLELFAGFASDDNGEIGEPKFVGNLRTTWDKGPWSVFYGVDVIGAVSSEQDLRNLSGRALDRCVTTASAATAAQFAGAAIRGGNYCNIYKFDPVFYHSASVTRQFGTRFSLTAGINNLFDTNPPRPSGSFGTVGTTGQTATFATQYDLIGRRAFLSARARF